jgi:hypothetical protein
LSLLAFRVLCNRLKVEKKLKNRTQWDEIKLFANISGHTSTIFQAEMMTKQGRLMVRSTGISCRWTCTSSPASVAGRDFGKFCRFPHAPQWRIPLSLSFTSLNQIVAIMATIWLCLFNINCCQVGNNRLCQFFSFEFSP